MNPIDNYPGIRKALYTVQWAVSGVMLLIGVGYAAAQTALPSWYAVVAAVLSALWAYTGITASTNVRQPTPLDEEPTMGNLPEPKDESGAIDTGGALGLLAILLIVLILAYILFR